MVRLKGESGKAGPYQYLIEENKDSFENTIQAYIVGNGIIAIFLSGVFQYLIDFLYVLQLMVIPVLFTLNHPNNAKIV